MVLAFSVFLEMHEIKKKRLQEASKRHVQGVEEEVALRSCHKMRFLSNGPGVLSIFEGQQTWFARRRSGGLAVLVDVTAILSVRDLAQATEIRSRQVENQSIHQIMD